VVDEFVSGRELSSAFYAEVVSRAVAYSAGLAQLADPAPRAATALRAAARNYSRALDQLSHEAGLAA
jgi:hypothetical protein